LIPSWKNPRFASNIPRGIRSSLLDPLPQEDVFAWPLVWAQDLELLGLVLLMWLIDLQILFMSLPRPVAEKQLP
jgi:hypothetical protein